MASEFELFLKDLLSPVGHVTFRRMFGGTGLFVDGTMFALIADDMLYFRVDGKTEPDFVAAGSSPFTYDRKSKPVSLSYWQVPEQLFDEPEAFAEWAQRAIAAAERVKSKKARR